MLKKIKIFCLTNKYSILFTFVLLLGIFIRAIGISDYPNALNVDEASAGYEAYSILTTGHDRNGNFLPVYLVAWGSGQNVLLTYLMLPFIQLFGLNTFSIRLPMLLISCLSLASLYFLLKNVKDKKLAFIGLCFFAICPWHIMKSRWGLESNLFPDFILFFLCLLVHGLKRKNRFSYYFSFFIAGISSYAYGTSFFFLPLFIVPLLILLIYKKEITLKQAFLSFLILLVITLPLILFVFINTFHLPQINLPFMTIPKLTVNRYEELTSIFSVSFLQKSIINFSNSLKILLLQYDNLPWNALKFFGTIYPFSIFFCILGIAFSFKRKNKELPLNYSYIFNLCFVVCLLLMFVCEPNINRLNIVFLPIIYFTIIGIYFLTIHTKKIISIFMIILYTLSFLLFIPNYFKQDWNTYYTFESDLEEVISYISSIKNTKIHITNKIKEAYIYTLFYSNYSSEDFLKTVTYLSPTSAFRQVTQFGNYYFENITTIHLKDEPCIYVIKKEDLKNCDFPENQFKLVFFKKYIVLEQIKN